MKTAIRLFLLVPVFLFALLPFSLGQTQSCFPLDQEIPTPDEKIREDLLAQETKEIWKEIPETVGEETEPPAEEPTSYLIENVPALCQYPDFPTGCESVCAVMVLHFWGKDVSMDSFVDVYLEREPDGFYLKRGAVYGPDPYQTFVGDPRAGKYSFGCMAPMIRTAMEKAVSGELLISDLTGTDLEKICRDQIANDRPTLVWVTRNMKSVLYESDWYLPNRKLFRWPKNEHCMVLVGYDETHYSLIDPETGTLETWPKELVEKRYQTLGKQALVASPT